MHLKSQFAISIKKKLRKENLKILTYLICVNISQTLNFLKNSDLSDFLSDNEKGKDKSDNINNSIEIK